MNDPLPEVHRLLDALREARERLGTREPFETVVIPMAAPSPELYADLETRGATGTMAFAWPGGDPAFTSIATKRDAIARFADAFIRT
jgi:hypothetical protein